MGLFSASNINAAETTAKPGTTRVELPSPIEPGSTVVMLLTAPPLEEAREAAR